MAWQPGIRESGKRALGATEAAGERTEMLSLAEQRISKEQQKKPAQRCGL